MKCIQHILIYFFLCVVYDNLPNPLRSAPLIFACYKQILWVMPSASCQPPCLKESHKERQRFPLQLINDVDNVSTVLCVLWVMGESYIRLRGADLAEGLWRGISFRKHKQTWTTRCHFFLTYKNEANISEFRVLPNCAGDLIGSPSPHSIGQAAESQYSVPECTLPPNRERRSAVT